MKKFLAILLASMLLVATLAVSASAAEVNLLAGKGLTTENTTIHGTNNNPAFVTDGKDSADIWAGDTLGVKAVDSTTNATVYVVFDKFDAATITGAKFNFGVDLGSGINRPYEPWLEAYVDGAWVKVANFDDAAAPEQYGVYTYTLEAPASKITTSQVRVGFYCYGWVWIGEIAVYAEGSNGGSTPSTPSKPATKTVDILKGLSYTLSGDGTSSWTGNITDGKASEELFDGSWVGVKDNNKEDGWVYVKFELDDVYTISGAELTYAIADGGIGIPYEMHLQASMDGETWTNVGKFDRVTNEQGIQEVKMTDVVETEAKYVRVRAVNSGWWFLGELNVYSEVEVQGGSTPDTGDASSMVIFMVIALVAMAGTATVIKTRR